MVGLDIGKYRLSALGRWPDGQFERPWFVDNPALLPDSLGLLGHLRQDHPLTVALAPSGTYGDPVRQALTDAGVPVRLVSPKAAHDYAEVVEFRKDGQGPTPTCLARTRPRRRNDASARWRDLMAGTDGHCTITEGTDMTSGVNLGMAHLRVARPTDDLAAVVRFYRDGLGLDLLYEFMDHEGFDGVMLGRKGASYHRRLAGVTTCILTAREESASKTSGQYLRPY